MRASDWIQTVTGIAVLIGLALVIVELQQSKELARMQLASDGWEGMMSNTRSAISENFATTRAKACLKPESLTLAELEEMDAFHYLSIAEVQRMRGHAHLSDYQYGWQGLAENNLSFIFSTPVGRAYYAVRRERLKGSMPWLVEIADKVLENGRIVDCRDDLMRMQEILQQAHEPPVEAPTEQ